MNPTLVIKSEVKYTIAEVENYVLPLIHRKFLFRLQRPLHTRNNKFFGCNRRSLLTAIHLLRHIFLRHAEEIGETIDVVNAVNRKGGTCALISRRVTDATGVD